MKNLVTLNRGEIVLESLTYPDLPVVALTYDPVADSITCCLANDEYVEVQQMQKSGQRVVLASFAVSAPGDVLLFAHFDDWTQLVFVFTGGDLVVATYVPEADCDSTTVEIVGLIDSGLQAAQWSPDDEIITLVTNDNKVLLLPRLFDDPICDKQLDANDIKILDSKHVSVGWGKKETQFKGRGAHAREREALKHAGLTQEGELRDPTVNEVERGTLSPLDRHTTKISWRGDGEYFAISTIEPVAVEDTGESYDRRVIRVFLRDGVLDLVNEAVDGLEHNLAWKPQGALIALTQRHTDDDGDDVLNVVFYERNGLRHGEFNSRLNPESAVIVDMQWSCDLGVLLIQLDNQVQLWTTKNYHWYLKQVYNFSSPVKFHRWHPEKPLLLMVATEVSLEMFDLATTVHTGATTMGADQGMTLVTDGDEIKITPLAVANVPPPVSFREVYVPEPIIDVCTNRSGTRFAAVGTTQLHITAAMELPLLPAPKVETSAAMDPGFAKQVAFIGDDTVVVAIDQAAFTSLVFYELDGLVSRVVDLETKAVVIKATADVTALAVELRDGQVFTYSQDGEPTYITTFPQLCREIEVLNDTAFGISALAKLYANDHEVCTNATSLKLSELHLLFTTSQLQLCFIHLDQAITENINFGELNDERVRAIERGSFLVNVMPLKYSVVLEAPRGNLETIHPRIMVLSAVRQLIVAGEYYQAFMACRTHRIDLDILHDYRPDLFMANVDRFVAQLGKVEHLDLFVLCLKEENVAEVKYRETKGDDSEPVAAVTEQLASLTLIDEGEGTKRIIRHERHGERDANSKVNRICEAILKVLEKPQNHDQYLQTIITAYACQKPPNIEDALKLIGGLKDEDHRELAITHLCFLYDVYKLYNLLLAIYNVRLALLVAQHSQMDPKEYLPFLQNLHQQLPLRQKFLIDDHLKNYTKALGWLFELAEAQEFDDYMVQHHLYKQAIAIYTKENNTQRTEEVYRLYAQYLFDDKQYPDAGLTYEYLGLNDAALELWVLAKRWKEALALVAQDQDRYRTVATDLVASLESDHRYVEAAEIERFVLGNVDAACVLYCKHYHYDQAILLAKLLGRPELIELIIDPQLGEGFGTIAELLADCKQQMNLQLRRLRELRDKKAEDPFAFYGMPEQDTADNVLIAPSETSTTPSFFTRYTGKTLGTAKTGALRKTAKNRKREERKRAKGRKGTIYEEEYLIRSVGRLIERLEQQQPDASNLIEGLLRRHQRERAVQIQHNWVELVAFITDNIEEIHNMSDRDRERLDDDGNVYLIDPIPVPSVPKFPVKAMLDF